MEGGEGDLGVFEGGGGEDCFVREDLVGVSEGCLGWKVGMGSVVHTIATVATVFKTIHRVSLALEFFNLSFGREPSPLCFSRSRFSIS